MTHAAHGGRRQRTIVLAAAAAVLVVIGVVVVIIATTMQQTPPTPQATPQHVAAAGPSSPSDNQLVLSRSIPTRITVPAIGVNSSLIKLGLNDDGTMQTPPLSDVMQAGWYRYSPTPGQRGPAVIVGHIDSREAGEGVFFHLGEMKPGEKINVTRADGITAVFIVDKLEVYPKSGFPTKKVYGNTPDAQLRLISCGGPFDTAKRSYRDNIVVYAHLDGVHKA